MRGRREGGEREEGGGRGEGGRRGRGRREGETGENEVSLLYSTTTTGSSTPSPNPLGNLMGAPNIQAVSQLPSYTWCCHSNGLMIVLCFSHRRCSNCRVTLQ